MALYDSEEPITSEIDLKEFTDSIRFHGIVETGDDLNSSYLAMTGEPREGVVVDVPIIKGADGPGVNYKGSVSSFDALPEAGKLGEIWQHATDGTAVIWTEDGWSNPFRWSGEKGDRGPAGPRGDASLPPRYRATLNSRSELSSVSSPKNGDFVVFTSGKGAQYWSGSWSADFQWVGPRGETTKGEKGDRGPKGDASRIVDAPDYKGGAASGYLYKDGSNFVLDNNDVIGVKTDYIRMEDGIFTFSNTKETTRKIKVGSITAPFNSELIIGPTNLTWDNAVKGGLNVFVTVTYGGTSYAGAASRDASAKSGAYTSQCCFGGSHENSTDTRIYMSKGSTADIYVTTVTYGRNMRTKNTNDGRICYSFMRK